MRHHVAPVEYSVGALRSALVAKLTGLSAKQLQHWHATSLQVATKEPGAAGTPRLYSWVDYQRLCVMAALLDKGVPTTSVRHAVCFLDAMVPEWWLISLDAYRAYSGAVPGSRARVHVAVRLDLDVLADVDGNQMTFRDALGGDACSVETALTDALDEMRSAGPLFRKQEFANAVWMTPHLNAAQPTVKGTSLETAFLTEYADRTSTSEAARVFRLDEWVVERAREFELAA